MLILFIMTESELAKNMQGVFAIESVAAAVVTPEKEILAMTEGFMTRRTFWKTGSSAEELAQNRLVVKEERGYAAKLALMSLGAINTGMEGKTTELGIIGQAGTFEEVSGLGDLRTFIKCCGYYI